MKRQKINVNTIQGYNRAYFAAFKDAKKCFSAISLCLIFTYFIYFILKYLVKALALMDIYTLYISLAVNIVSLVFIFLSTKPPKDMSPSYPEKLYRKNKYLFNDSALLKIFGIIFLLVSFAITIYFCVMAIKSVHYYNAFFDSLIILIYFLFVAYALLIIASIFLCIFYVKWFKTLRFTFYGNMLSQQGKKEAIAHYNKNKNIIEEDLLEDDMLEEMGEITKSSGDLFDAFDDVEIVDELEKIAEDDLNITE